MHLVLADIDGRGLRDLARTIPGAIAVRADVSRMSDVESLASKAYARFGAVHLLCNNAGVAEYGAVWEVPVRRWRRVIGANLWGAVHGCLAFVPRMIAQGESAHIVNTASMAGLVTPPFAGAYSVSKHAVVAGSVTVKRVPREPSAPASMVPPCLSTMLLHMLRPRPRPPAPFAEVKGLNSR